MTTTISRPYRTHEFRLIALRETPAPQDQALVVDELAPVFLSQAPIDPLTGRAPESTRSGAGYALKAAAPAGTSEATRKLLDWTIPR